MLVALLTGGATGAGAYLIVRGIARPRPALAETLRSLDRTRGADASSPAATARAVVEGLGVDLGRLSLDLRVAGRSPQRHALEKLMAAIALAALPVMVTGLLEFGGVSAPAELIAATCAAMAVLGFVIPDLLLRTEARRRRAEFRHALSAYLDLVAIVVAGGGGMETALLAAAETGEGWAFAELRHALRASHLGGTTPWAGLERLGTDLGVDELREFASSVELAGEHGARVRQSLATRARSLREHRLAEVESEAQAATERMSLPVVLMLFGFLAFVLYPALQFVLEGL